MNQESEYTEVDLKGLAEQLDCDLIVADERTLLVDLDSEYSEARYRKNLEILKQRYAVVSIERYPSRKQRQDDDFTHEHVIVTLREPIENPIERLLLQAALGSDPTKELCSLYRLRDKHETPSVLFRPRNKAAAEQTSKKASTDDSDAIFA